jgi:chemotaxis protein methyltransferase CheR
MTLPTSENEPIRVLCVDDSASIIALLKAILSPKFGFTVVGVAENGKVAVQMVKDLKPDVVTLDIHMPELDGVSYMENHFQKGAHPPVLMISSVAREETELAQRAINAGASDYVEKPAFNNLNKHAEEIRMKLQAALQAGRSNVIHQNFDKGTGVDATAKSGRLTRVIIVGAGDETRLPLVFSQVQGDQPPTIILIDVALEAFEGPAAAVKAGVYKNLGIIKDPSLVKMNEVGVMRFADGLKACQSSFKAPSVCVCVIGVPSGDIVDAISSWQGILLLMEELDSSGQPSYQSLKKIAKDCTPIHSIGYMSLKLAS